ncbi:MAG: hypothetical protein LBK25_04165 [Treponema sp.]|nr:hypothetical protein [Treponema sp.]
MSPPNSARAYGFGVRHANRPQAWCQTREAHRLGVRHVRHLAGLGVRHEPHTDFGVRHTSYLTDFGVRYASHTGFGVRHARHLRLRRCQTHEYLTGFGVRHASRSQARCQTRESHRLGVRHVRHLAGFGVRYASRLRGFGVRHVSRLTTSVSDT